MTNLAAGSLVNNIIGPWASFNTGASTTYATINASNTIVGLGYTGGADGVAPGAASIVTDTTGTLNYSVNTATGTLGTNASINTLRYTAAASILTTATSFTTNGILNAGTGALTITGNVTIGATKELVLNAANSGITITNNIVNNAGGASALVINGSGTTTLNGLASTYSGGTFVNQGSLTTAASGNATDTPFGNASGTVTVNPGTSLALNRTYVPNAVVMNAATLSSGNSFSSTLAGGVTLTGANTFNITGGLAISSNFTGTGTLTKTGASTINFVSGTNYNAGPLIISGGVVGFANAATLFGGSSITWTPANITVGSGVALGLRYGGGSDFTSSQRRRG
jgi:autotransporter-associated beta strand protein